MNTCDAIFDFKNKNNFSLNLYFSENNFERFSGKVRVKVPSINVKLLKIIGTTESLIASIPFVLYEFEIPNEMGLKNSELYILLLGMKDVTERYYDELQKHFMEKAILE